MRVTASTAALDAVYALSAGGASRTTCEDTLTIEPPPRTRRAACWSTTTVPRTLTR
jgi:hypothetical protein